MAGLFDIFGTSDQQAAAQAQQQGYQQGYGQLSQLLGMGNQTLAQNYGQAIQPFQQLLGQTQPGVSQLGNALGLGGAAGNAQALQGFQNNPGYQFQLQQGTQNVDRNQAAAGMLGSGNTDAAVSNYTTGLANQSWNQYLQNLQPYLGAAQNAATGAGNLFAGLGQGINQNVNTQGQAAYGTPAGIGNAQAASDLSGLTASGNQLGALMGLLKLGTSGAGASGGGGGTIGGNLFSAYSGASLFSGPQGIGMLPPG